MEDYDKFLELFIEAIESVDEEYFRTSSELYYGLKWLHDSYGKFEDKVFHRYGERLFAYELYHKLQNLIFETKERGHFFNNYSLQGEIKKMNLKEVMDIFGYQILDGAYSPDLLYHIPSHDANAFVIEIKAQPSLDEDEIKDDLSKLSQFLIRIKYQKAIFLAVNIDEGHVINSIINKRDEIEKEIEDRLNDCYVIVKEKYNSKIFCRGLNEILK